MRRSLALVRRLKRKVPLDNLCFAGGVALNCVTNDLIRQSGEFSDVFIPSAPHDAGTAIGAAYVVHCARQKSPPERGNYTPYLGPAFDAARNPGGGQVGRSHAPAKQVPGARRCGHDRRRQDRRLVSGSHGIRAARARQPVAARRPAPARHARHPQQDGQAPRGFPAVCAERAGRTRRRMVRGRRAHRPVTNSCCLHAPSSPSSASASRPSCTTTAAPGCRSCSAQSNPRFHELMSCFFEKTGVPMVVNTSYNDSEPIVCTPDRRDRHLPQVRH